MVADDHELTRYSLKLVLASQENLNLVALARNGREAVDLVRQYCPDIAILDLQMPVLDGLSAAMEIKRDRPQTRIIAYTSWEDSQTELTVKAAGVDAYCPKDAPTEQLLYLILQLGHQAPSPRNYS